MHIRGTMAAALERQLEAGLDEEAHQIIRSFCITTGGVYDGVGLRTRILWSWCTWTVLAMSRRFPASSFSDVQFSTSGTGSDLVSDFVKAGHEIWIGNFSSDPFLMSFIVICSVRVESSQIGRKAVRSQFISF